MIVPGSANPLLLASAAAAGGLQVSRSLRFNAADSAYLSRTPASAGNRKTWTWSGWVKRSKLGSGGYIFSCDPNTTNYAVLYWDSGVVVDALSFQEVSSGSQIAFRRTAAVYRDPSAWYHIVFAVDTTQATAADRIKLYVNGSQVTTFNSTQDPTQNSDLSVNSTSQHNIGRMANFANPFDGYLANIHFIDGQALTPASFAETDATTGQWIPKAFSGGSYGTNGFYLQFADNSSNTASTLGKDTSGNGNNWTPNNLSVTAGAGNDSLIDSPTNGSQTDTGVGGEVRGNYCTWNPLDKGVGTLSNGNLDFLKPNNGWDAGTRGTIGVSSGKWYWEITKNNSANYSMYGVALSNASFTEDYGAPNNETWTYESNSGNKFGDSSGGSGTAYGATFTTGDVIGVALDMTAGTLVFYKNGVSQGTAFSTLAGKILFPWIDLYTSSDAAITNFGQRAFAYTAPSGFKALCTTNLPAPLVTKSNTVMDASLWTGNGTQTIVSGLQFSPDFVWIKSRSSTAYHMLFDIVRGAQARLHSNTTDQEQTGNNDLTSFNSDGYTLDNNSSPANTDVNGSGITYVGWAWDAGTSTVSNTQGSITSQVRANATAGFSVVTYTGTGSTASVGHGLGIAPAFYITKRRDSSSFGNWTVYHSSVGTQALELNSTGAAFSDSTRWPSAATSTVFNIGSNGNVNTSSGTYVAYCFSPVVGYNSISSYTGNGSSDGVFVYTGHRVRWLMIKRTDVADSWQIMDAARSDYNVADDQLYADLSNAEATTSSRGIDFLSNGFKIRGDNSGINASGGTYVYVSFAEAPLNYSRAR